MYQQEKYAIITSAEGAETANICKSTCGSILQEKHGKILFTFPSLHKSYIPPADVWEYKPQRREEGKT